MNEQLLLPEPIESKKARAFAEIKKRWKRLSGEQISKLMIAYFKEYHTETPKSQTETSKDETARTFDGGLF